MFCIKCGKQLPDEAAFCFACGAKVWVGDSPASSTETPASAFGNPQTATPMNEKDVLTVSMDAKVDFGNFFIVGNNIYFLTHGYHPCEHTQLWKSDLQGNNKTCVLDFDKTSYIPSDFIQGDDAYYMAKIDHLILFQVYDKNNDYYNYYYDLKSNSHNVIKSIPRVPYTVSQDGTYFVEGIRDPIEDNAVIITLTTPYEALLGSKGREIYLNERTLWTFFGSFGNDINFTANEFFVYNGHQLLIAFYSNADYLWARIDLFNLSDFAILKPAEYMIAGRSIIISEESSVFFTPSRSYEPVYIDTNNMTVKATVPMGYSTITRYGSLAYISSSSSENSILFDLKSGKMKTISAYSKVFEITGSKNILQTPSGFYKYSHESGDTKLYFISNSDIFKPFDGEYYDDNECVTPIISLSYTRDFTPIIRNSATDENVYSYDNTKELDTAVSLYLKETNEELFDKLSWSTFFYSKHITLPDGKRVGFTYGHKKGYENADNYYYNLYELKLDGSYKYLNCGSRGGIEYLKIYKNYAYWVDVLTYRYDFNTGEFLESRDEWLREEYDAICAKEENSQL
ncbi:MAG: zinc ribbon domain-containing protein [Clostridia bacterium]|nr:zinc ribbon domain-containing protein [Clostridia bacterium]